MQMNKNISGCFGFLSCTKSKIRNPKSKMERTNES